ncbi:MAG: DCC1-like thiol-disulfide oxidoreductase family protein [Candidatus Eisenbacteria bacterium]
MNSSPSRRAPPPSLPGVRAYPIVLFDGLCDFCNVSVNFIIDRDPSASLRFAPLQSEIGQALLREHGLPAGFEASLVLFEGRRVYTESAGVLGIAAHMKRPWSWLRYLRIVPAFVRDAAYRFIGDRRSRWFGRSEACPIPTPQKRERFLG